jgi:aminoglycoside phosphotransferase (APT) family kinase protein
MSPRLNHEHHYDHESDPVLSDEVVLGLARRHGAGAQCVEAVDESGGEARVYVCGDVVVKTQRPHRRRARTSLEKEAFILEQLAAQGVSFVPRVLGYGREGDIEYEVLTRIEGVALRHAGLDALDRQRVLAEAGAALRAVHDVDQAVLERSNLIPADEAPSDLMNRVTSQLAEFSGLLRSRGGQMASIDSWNLPERCAGLLPSRFSLTTLHSNPGEEHCFVNPSTGRFTGLIDFGDAYRSHPALDVRTWRSLRDSRDLLSGYMSGVPLSASFMGVWRVALVLGEIRVATRVPREASALREGIDQILAGHFDPN